MQLKIIMELRDYVVVRFHFDSIVIFVEFGGNVALGLGVLVRQVGIDLVVNCSLFLDFIGNFPEVARVALVGSVRPEIEIGLPDARNSV